MEMVKEFHHLLQFSGIPIGGKIKKTPVEERGYKNIFNLPDWPKNQKIQKNLNAVNIPCFFNSPCF
jgi:hypothetical protein